MSFQIDFVNFSMSEIPTLTIEMIGHFSIDGDDKYQADLSQLKYYIPPPNPDDVNFDLNLNSTSTHYKSTSHIKLDNVLRWISDNFHQLENKPRVVQKERWLDVDFICSRGTIKTVLCSPYQQNFKNGWIICASKYRGTIYLCKFYTDEKEQDHVTADMEERQSSSWGRKFEQYMVADHPLDLLDPKQSLNECEAFHCMFKAKFDRHSLLYEAEIDGISSQQPITDTLVDKTFQLIELKTCPMYTKKGKSTYRMSPERVSNWWSQSYLLQINRIICGLKDKDRKVKKIKEFSLQDLPNLSKPRFDTHKCEIFCKIFLDNVKRIVTKDYNECIYSFHWSPDDKNVVNYSEEVPDHERYFFMNKWFVDKAEKFRKHSQNKRI